MSTFDWEDWGITKEDWEAYVEDMGTNPYDD